MKKIVALVGILALAVHLYGQHAASPVGEYLLQGEMETAAGLKLDSNGQFRFFFSYGALDREASGRWRMEGERLVLTSEAKGAKDFQLIQSRQSPAKHVTISLSGGPPEILHYFIATGMSGSKQVSGNANEKGEIILPLPRVDSLLLQFEWCPEKVFRYRVASPRHNRFSFRILPSITDVVFDNDSFTVSADGITGTLPFAGEHRFAFRRTNTNGQAPE